MATMLKENKDPIQEDVAFATNFDHNGRNNVKVIKKWRSPLKKNLGMMKSI